MTFRGIGNIKKKKTKKKSLDYPVKSLISPLSVT